MANAWHLPIWGLQAWPYFGTAVGFLCVQNSTSNEQANAGIPNLVFIYIYIYVYVHMYICMHMYTVIYICIHMYTWLSVERLRIKQGHSISAAFHNVACLGGIKCISLQSSSPQHGGYDSDPEKDPHV